MLINDDGLLSLPGGVVLELLEMGMQIGVCGDNFRDAVWEAFRAAETLCFHQGWSLYWVECARGVLQSSPPGSPVPTGFYVVGIISALDADNNAQRSCVLVHTSEGKPSAILSLFPLPPEAAGPCPPG